MPTHHLEVLNLWKSDENDVYETQGSYLPTKTSNDDFWNENEENDF